MFLYSEKLQSISYKLQIISEKFKRAVNFKVMPLTTSSKFQTSYVTFVNCNLNWCMLKHRHHTYIDIYKDTYLST